MKWIKNPTEEVQLAAVTQNPYAIIYIENPSGAVMEEVISKNKEFLKYFKEEWFSSRT